jgi:hypothetical protein
MLDGPGRSRAVRADPDLRAPDRRQARAEGHGSAHRRRPPFGFKLGPVPAAAKGNAGVLVPDTQEQKAIRTIVKLRAEGLTLMRIRSLMATVHGVKLSHQTIGKILARQRTEAAA